MAVLKKIRSRWWSPSESEQDYTPPAEQNVRPATGFQYDIRPLTISQLDECWRLDQRCFVDGEAYSRETFDYLLTAPESVSYRAVTTGGVMVGFVIGLVEPDHTGHVTTVGVAPEHRRRHLGKDDFDEVGANSDLKPPRSPRTRSRTKGVSEGLNVPILPGFGESHRRDRPPGQSPRTQKWGHRGPY